MANYNETELKKIVGEIATKNGLSDKTQIKIYREGGEGGYMSEMVTIDVTDETTGQTLHLIAKISFKDEEIRAISTFEEYYNNELNMYENFFPTIHRLQSAAGIPEPFNSTPKFYAGTSLRMNEYVILENLKRSGFELLKLRHLLDHEHAAHIFREYGKFHGMSFVLRTKEPNTFETIKNKVRSIWDIILDGKEMGKMMHDMIKEISSIVKDKGLQSKRLDNYTEKFLEIMKEMINHKEDKYTCFLHGDCWSNNVMFKYEVIDGKKKLQDMKFIDFQSSRLGPPVFDLTYSLYSGASKEVLDNLDTYLKIYHESMSNILAKFNMDINAVYPLQELKNQWRKYCHYGAILGTLIWKLRSMEENDIEKISHIVPDSPSHFDEVIVADCNTKYLTEHIKMLYDHLDKITGVDM